MQETSEGKVKTEKALTSAEHLEAILYQFIKLYERWSEDRQAAAKQGSDIADLIKEFTDQVAHFEALEENVREDIQKSIRQEAENTAAYFGQAIGDAAYKQMKPAVKKLEDAVDDARNRLDRQHSDLIFSDWKILGATVLATITTSLLIVKLLMPPPVMALTEKQLNVYEIGKSFLELWPTLSKEKQKWFLDKKNNKEISYSQIKA